MIFSETYLRSIDNSGALFLQCIKVLGKVKYGSLGDKVIVVVKKMNPVKKVKKASKLVGIIVQVRKNVSRTTGQYVLFGENRVIILNPKKKLMGNRILGPICLEIRKRRVGRILCLVSLFF